MLTLHYSMLALQAGMRISDELRYVWILVQTHLRKSTRKLSLVLGQASEIWYVLKDVCKLFRCAATIHGAMHIKTCLQSIALPCGLMYVTVHFYVFFLFFI